MSDVCGAVERTKEGRERMTNDQVFSLILRWNNSCRGLGAMKSASMTYGIDKARQCNAQVGDATIRSRMEMEY